VLLCCEHGEGWSGLTPLTSEDLPDGGTCTWGMPFEDEVCGRDVLIPVEPAAPDPWAVVARLTAWLDDHNGSSTPETALRLMKVQEEAGEVAAAWIGVVGQNPRKGVTHTTGEVLGELCDVIVAAMVAMTTLTRDPAARFAAKLESIAALRLDTEGGES
jgi:hypothetical protein